MFAGSTDDTKPQGIEYHLTINEELEGRTVQSVLRTSLQLSRRMLRQLAANGGVRLNQAPARNIDRVGLGDELTFVLPTETSEIEPESLPIDVRYEDAMCVVVNKPADMLTHPTSRERRGSLLAAAKSYIHPEVPHCVHRLDRDTSGLVLLARHGHFHHLFDEALRAGRIHRAYCALIHLPEETADLLLDDGLPVDAWRTIDLPIAQDPRAPSRRIISATGQRSITHYRILRRVGCVALVFVVLETGRTHQIRLHFSAVGCGLLGDPVYRARRISASGPGAMSVRNESAVDSEGGSATEALNRQALHGIYLRFLRPLSEEEQEVYAPPPEDLISTWTRMGGEGSDWPDLTLLSQSFMNCPLFDNIDTKER